MVRTTSAAQPTPTEVDEHTVFADAALALADHEVADPNLRSILQRAARHELTGEEAIAAIRRHVQG